MSGHTPGRWWPEVSAEDDGVIVIKCDSWHASELARLDLKVSRITEEQWQAAAEEQDANAALMCAAPELLRACERALRHMTDHKARNDPDAHLGLVAELEHALKLARGES